MNGNNQGNNNQNSNIGNSNIGNANNQPNIQINLAMNLVQVVPGRKPIYTCPGDPTILVKVSDSESLAEEMRVQSKAYAALQNDQHFSGRYNPCPRVISYLEQNGKYYLIMKKIDGQTIADRYGEEPNSVPNHIWEQIHLIVYVLFYHNIHYIDVSSYNFLVDNNDRVYIIDFGHAKEIVVDDFLKDCLVNTKAWNPMNG